jgi:drug/metabolite transporter (DMT)-like permease
MNTVLTLLAIIASTFAGDYFIKVSSEREGGLLSFSFLLGAILYGLPAIGFFFLMRDHSLAAVGVLYSAATIILMSVLGYFVFKEAFGLREAIGLSLAVLSVIVMSHGS